MSARAGSNEPPLSRGKSPAAFRTITEVAADLNVPQHVLRFWETKFPQIKPLKRGGGRRYYRPEDVATLQEIQHLLYADGYTIRGAQKRLRERAPGAAITGRSSGAATAGADRTAPPPGDRTRTGEARLQDELRAVLAELEAIRRLLPEDPDGH